MITLQKRLFVVFLVLASITIIQSQAYGYEQAYGSAIFVDWAYDHDIYLVGINKSSEYLVENGYNPYSDRINLDKVPNLDILENTLYGLSDSVLDLLHGKTIYVSTQNGRSMTIPNSQTIENMNSGIILEQKIEDYYILHEIGHIVELSFDIEESKWREKNQLFSIAYFDLENIDNRPKGYVTYYSLTNQHENFAEHFAHYVVNGNEFRKHTDSDSLLDLKYQFLKQYVFESIEY